MNIERLLRPVRGFQLQRLNDNCFILKFNYKLDRTHALEGSPWLLDRCALLLSLIPSEANPETMALDLMNIVVRLHNIPAGLRNPDMTGRLCEKMGTVLEVIPPKGDTYQVYMRVRMQIMITKPFIRGTYLRLGEGRRQWVSFSYERMPTYCFLCGLVDHMEKKCPMRFQDDFIDPGTEFPYGEWLKATPFAAPGQIWSTGSSNGPVRTSSLESPRGNRGMRIFEVSASDAPSRGQRGVGTMDENDSHLVNQQVMERKGVSSLVSKGSGEGKKTREVVKVSQTKNRKK